MQLLTIMLGQSYNENGHFIWFVDEREVDTKKAMTAVKFFPFFKPS